MANTISSIFYRPITIIWMYLARICFDFYVNYNHLQNTTTHYLRHHWAKGHDKTDTLAQQRKLPKRITSEWLKWKHSCHNEAHRLGISSFYRNLKKTVTTATNKFMHMTNNLLSRWTDSSLAFLSTGRRSRRKYTGKRNRQSHHNHIDKSWNPSYLLSLQVIALASTSGTTSAMAVFDSDSYPILIDNCCTAYITNCIKDFYDVLQSTKSSINGIGGNIGITMQGTIKWAILDDLGKHHTFYMTNSYFAPDAPHQLFSPQHWSQTAFTNQAQSGWASTYHDRVVLHWNEDRFCWTIPLDKRSNVARLMTAPGCKHLWAYEAQVQTNTSKIIPICFKVNLVSADNDDPTIHPLQSSISASKGEGLTHNLPTQEQSQSESLARNGHQQTMNITRSQETREQDTNPSALMLKMHYKLGH